MPTSVERKTETQTIDSMLIRFRKTIQAHGLVVIFRRKQYFMTSRQRKKITAFRK